MTGQHAGADERRHDVATLAASAAEAIRALNHATFPGATGLTGPADVYAVLADLALMASRVPQLVAQLDRWLARQVDAGAVVVDGGEYAGDPPAAAAVAGHWLEHAGAAAHQLAAALDHAQQAIAYAADSDPADDRHDD